MGTTDTAAESDVVEEVRGLNAEIFNLARSITERASPSECDQNARHNAEKMLRDAQLLEPCFSLFRSAKARDDAVLEIATQAVATRYLSQIVSAWTAQPQIDYALAKIYENIRRTGKPFQGP